jgi:hypothetical protein
MVNPAKSIPLPAVSPKEAQDLIRQLDQVTKDFKGQLDELESAIGMYMVGRLVGWKVLVLIHNKRTIRKYEEILGGINIREIFPEEGPFAHKSVGLEIAKKLGNFWKVVSGEQKVEERRELVKA